MHDAAPTVPGRFLPPFGPYRENIVNILHGRHRALESALSITGIVAFECALVMGVLLVLHIDPGL
jgi:hypothetical protein